MDKDLDELRRKSDDESDEESEQRESDSSDDKSQQSEEQDKKQSDYKIDFTRLPPHACSYCGIHEPEYVA